MVLIFSTRCCSVSRSNLRTFRPDALTRSDAVDLLQWAKADDIGNRMELFEAVGDDLWRHPAAAQRSVGQDRANEGIRPQLFRFYSWR